MDQTNPAGVSLDLHDETNRRAMESALPAFIGTRRWFGAKSRTIRQARVVDSIAVARGDAHQSHIAIVLLTYGEGDSQHYVLPLRLDLLPEHTPDVVTVGGYVADWVFDSERGARTIIASDGAYDAGLASALLEAISQGHRWPGANGEIVAWRTPELAALAPTTDALAPSVMGVEQSNTSIKYGEALILKLVRRLEEGTSPELEVGRALQAARFGETPPLGGAIEYVQPTLEPLTLAVLQGYVPNRGDAWGYTIETLVGYYDRALEGTNDSRLSGLPSADLLDLVSHPVPEDFARLAGGYTGSAALLGRTTAHMHLALARADAGPAFDPEPLDLEHREQMYDAMRLQADQAFGLLRNRLAQLPPDASDEANAVLRHSGEIEAHFGPLMQGDTGGIRTRVHGDYHLGQVLYTGSEFYIIDFEGEPARSLAERRRKHSPLKDVAGMVRSFHYAAYSGLFNHRRNQGDSAAVHPGDEQWADAWYCWASTAFLRAYLDTVEGSGLLPSDTSGLRVLLSAYLLEKAVYELVYELNNRPAWVAIPLKGISALLA